MTINFDEYKKKYPNTQRENLIHILQEIQDECGYLSEDAITWVSRYFNLPASKIYGLATFYNYFCFSPRGKYHIEICEGTSCQLKAARATIKEFEKVLKISNGQTTKNGMFSFQVVPCLGACGIAPVVKINNEYYSHVMPSQVNSIIEHYINIDENE
jgi:NADH-quinone oxidoreductase subunit E